MAQIIMSEKAQGVVRWLEVLGLLVGLLSGSISLGLVVFKGGALVSLVDQHESRLNHIEERGSPPYSEHFKLDDEREARSKERLTKVEEAVAAFQQMRVDMARLQKDVETLVREMDRSRKATP